MLACVFTSGNGDGKSNGYTMVCFRYQELQASDWGQRQLKFQLLDFIISVVIVVLKYSRRKISSRAVALSAISGVPCCPIVSKALANVAGEVEQEVKAKSWSI